MLWCTTGCSLPRRSSSRSRSPKPSSPTSCANSSTPSRGTASRGQGSQSNIRQPAPAPSGCRLPRTGPFAAPAAGKQRGAQVAGDELNAKGGVMSRKVEMLFRDDQLKPAVGAQRTKELIENEKCLFIVGGLAAHVQMAINEQTKKSKVLFISTSQSDESSAKPDTSP